jgi:hypothetical protein
LAARKFIIAFGRLLLGLFSQLMTINMWVWEQVAEGRQETRGALAKEERLALAVTTDLLAAFLSAALLPVYTLKTGNGAWLWI